MFGDCSFWPCFGDRQAESEVDPVLLVSGIGGSVLHAKRKKFGCETRVWVRILLAELEFKRKVWSRYNPKTGRYVHVASSRDVDYVDPVPRRLGVTLQILTRGGNIIYIIDLK